jgi:hypothetical protein
MEAPSPLRTVTRLNYICIFTMKFDYICTITMKFANSYKTELFFFLSLHLFSPKLALLQWKLQQVGAPNRSFGSTTDLYIVCRVRWLL